MNYFMCYQQYDPVKYDDDSYDPKAINLKATSPLPFAESMEGKLLLLQSKHQFILQNVFPQQSLDVLLNYFLNVSEQLLKSMGDTERAELSRTLQSVLAQTIKTWQGSLTEKEYTYAQLKTTLEILYLCLYSAYFQHFRKSIFSSFLQGHKKLLPASFFETQLGQDINNHLQTIILAETAKLVSQQRSLQLVEAGLTAQPITSNSTGFTLTFARQSF
jgi:uncharacterized protein YqkB